MRRKAIVRRRPGRRHPRKRANIFEVLRCYIGMVLKE